jgi:hypothetical protein
MDEEKCEKNGEYWFLKKKLLAALATILTVIGLALSDYLDTIKIEQATQEVEDDDSAN